MNPIYDEFKEDLNSLNRIITLIEKTVEIKALTYDASEEKISEVVAAFSSVQSASRAAHTDVPILYGVLLLYLAGRLEYFVRIAVEDLADTIAGGHSSFSDLPRVMRDNLVVYTAEVIASPRKYGHGEKGVASFVKTLADNLAGNLAGGINSKCLSITSEYMRPDVLSDLFKRVAAKDIWERIGQQTAIQHYFNEAQADRAASESKRMLNDLMDIRNEIAHPSPAFIWPSFEKVKEYVKYCDVLAQSISGICLVWSGTLGKGDKSATQAPQS